MASDLQPHEIAAFLLLFIGGFLLYSFINTAIASIVNSNDDLTTTLVPVEMLADFKAHMEAILGEGRCHVLSIRPEGGAVL